MTTCLLQSPDCQGELKPLPVLSDEELERRFPEGAIYVAGHWFPRGTAEHAVKPLDAILSDPRRGVRCGECDGDKAILSHQGVADPCPTCNGTGIAHVCERHREALSGTINSESIKRVGGRTPGRGVGRPASSHESFSLSDDNRAYLREFEG